MDSAASMLTVADIVRHHGRTRSERAALYFEGRILGYGELDRRASRVAQGLIAAGVKPGARIAILAKNDLTFFELWFGAVKAGAVLVPVNFRLAPPEIAYVVNDAKADLLFVGRDFYPLVEKLGGELASVRRVVALDGEHPEWPAYAAWVAAQEARDPALPLAAADVAIQMYTSGTTGHPKGAQLSHANLLALLPTVIARAGPWHEGDVSLVCLPLFHIGGSGWALLALYRGAANLITRDFEPAAILRLIGEYRVTKALFVPAMLLFLLQAPQCADSNFSSLELIVYGASPAPLDLLRNALRTFGCALGQLYGLTESTGGVTYLAPEDHGEHAIERMRSCGTPLDGVEIKVVDAEGRELPPGEVGEVICRTPQVMLGYWNLPEATARAIRDGWLYTGDAGYRDADGYLYIYDRIKDMIISGGENIYPAEVESALFGHPAVADVAVIGVPDEQWGEAVKAIVVKKPGASIDADELIAFARERIARYKVPRSVDFVAALPRNPSGKILKRELRKPYWGSRARQIN
jgi:acyl-CoA synthetase (AMP-forming)/AMP-acid ligase II